MNSQMNSNSTYMKQCASKTCYSELTNVNSKRNFTINYSEEDIEEENSEEEDSEENTFVKTTYARNNSFAVCCGMDGCYKLTFEKYCSQCNDLKMRNTEKQYMIDVKLYRMKRQHVNKCINMMWIEEE